MQSHVGWVFASISLVFPLVLFTKSIKQLLSADEKSTGLCERVFKSLQIGRFDHTRIIVEMTFMPLLLPFGRLLMVVTIKFVFTV